MSKPNIELQKFRTKRGKRLLSHLITTSLQYKLWIAFLLILILLGLIGYYRQLRYGLVVTAMRDYTSWGIYISNFVFFVATSFVVSYSCCFKVN